MYSYLSKISSEIRIFNFGCLSSGHYILTWARMWGSVVILRRQKGSASKRLGRDLKLLFSLASDHFSKGFLTKWQKIKKKGKLVSFQLDDRPAKEWDRFQALSHRHEKRWLSSSCLPSVRMFQLGLHWTDFCEIWYWSLLLKSVEQSYIWLKSYKNVGHFSTLLLLLKYFVARQQYKITHCWISMAAVSMFVLFT